jgi:hypothetical protein
MSTFTTAEDIVNETVADARWFPLRFNVQTGDFHFAYISPERHREIAFLKDAKFAAADTRLVPGVALRDVPLHASKLHLILHSGLGGSTLLARAMAQPGVSISLQEPPILTDVIAYGLTRSPAESENLLGEVTRLLSRPLEPGETVLCKMNSIGNGLAVPIAAGHPGSQVICLETPLEEMLTSFVSRGSEGRIAARKLLVGLRNSRMLPIQLSDGELIAQTDLQLCALAWLAMRKAMQGAASKLGSQRVGSITSGQLTGDTRNALLAVAGHFGLDLDVDEQLASGVFDKHAKTGEPFNANHRARRVAHMLQLHASEIDPIVNWARNIADAAEIRWELPYPLLG